MRTPLHDRELLPGFGLMRRSAWSMWAVGALSARVTTWYMANRGDGLGRAQCRFVISQQKSQSRNWAMTSHNDDG